MLELPTRRGQCLFCSCLRASRAITASGTKPSAKRGLATDQVPRIRRKHSKHTDDSPTGRRPLASRIDSRNGVRRPRIPELKGAWSPNPFVVDTGVRLKSSLQQLYEQLHTTKVDATSDVSLLASLDPSGTYWPPYKKQLESAIAGDAAITGFDGLVADIGRAQKGDWKTELPRVLHFGFIDYVLMRKAQDMPEEGSAFADLKFPTEWYTSARQVQRDVHLHIGPTNSGKTYRALKRLEESGDGFYAGPLRLLAHEVYSRFKAKGTSCDLITGDDVRLDDNVDTKLKASTVEMVDIGHRFEVAVIDEIQMMADQDRGWAWTRAFLGANAKEVHLCGEARVLPLIRELTASTGDILHVHEYQRLNPLRVMAKTLKGNLKNLRKGDCIVAFSVMNIHALKKQIELDTGRRCAIVYGSLPPETRAQQAALFNDPANDYDYLVASDAIGMGLNLSVKRIIFHATSKFNGVDTVHLTTAQIKQIGGRAGRFRSAQQAMTNNNIAGASENIGLVTTLNDEDLPMITYAMNEEAAPIKRAGMLPPAEIMEEFEAHLPKGVPFEYILRRVCGKASMHERFQVCSIRDQSAISRTIESVRGLSMTERVMLTAAPATRSTTTDAVMKDLAHCVAERRQVTIVDIPSIPLEVLEKPISGDRGYLEKLEDLHKSLVLYLWLSYRFLGIFKERGMATYAKEMVEERINTCLMEFSANPDLRKRVLAIKKRLPETQDYAAEGHGQETQIPQGLENGSETALPADWTTGSDRLEFGEEPAVA